MMAPVHSTLETVRYWAGQKLLHSPLHPLYLKLTRKEPKPQTYEAYLLAERLGPAAEMDASRFRMVLEPGVAPRADAAYWLMREAERSGATRVYADEDQVDPEGRRHSPVFRPGWSPELAAHCDYIGGCYLERLDATGDRHAYARVPRVLFHRATGPRRYEAANAASAPSPRPALTSVIVCSRSPRLLKSCLRGLATTKDLEIISVLHMGQGQDDALRQVAQRISRTMPLEYGEGFHFGRMCNQAAARARGEYLLFLNDDVTPLHPEWLDYMLAQAQRPHVGAVGALLLFPDGRIQHAGVLTGTSNGAGHPGRLSNGSPLWPWLTMTREQLAVTGACLLMPKRVFREIDGFDEAFPVNYNDVDLCLRAGKAGYRVIQECRAKLEHAESATRKIGIRYGERRLFLDRWANLLATGDPYFNPNLTDNELLLPDPDAPSRVIEVTDAG